MIDSMFGNYAFPNDQDWLWAPDGKKYNVSLHRDIEPNSALTDLAGSYGARSIQGHKSTPASIWPLAPRTARRKSNDMIEMKGKYCMRGFWGAAFFLKQAKPSIGVY